MSVTPRPYLYQDLAYLGGASAHVEEIFAALGQSKLFEGLSRGDCEQLCGFMHCFAAPRGTVLLEEGVEGEHLILVLEGHVRVAKKDLAGNEIGLAVVGPGSVLGEMSMIDGEHRFASCETLEPVKFAVLTRTDLHELLAEHPRLGNKLLIWMLQSTIGRLRDAGLRLIPHTTNPIA